MGDRRIFRWVLVGGLIFTGAMIALFIRILSMVSTRTDVTGVTTDCFVASGTIAALILPTAQLADQFTGRLVDRWTKYIAEAPLTDQPTTIAAAGRKYNRGEGILRLSWLGAVSVFLSFFLAAIDRVTPLDQATLHWCIGLCLGLLVSGLFLLLPLVIYAFDFSSFAAGWRYIDVVTRDSGRGVRSSPLPTPGGLDRLAKIGFTKQEILTLNPCVSGEFTMPDAMYVNTAGPEIVYRGSGEGTLPLVEGRWYMVPSDTATAHPELVKKTVPVAWAPRLAQR